MILPRIHNEGALMKNEWFVQFITGLGLEMMLTGNLLFWVNCVVALFWSTEWIRGFKFAVTLLGVSTIFILLSILIQLFTKRHSKDA
jgi:membrane protein implicated in regulation of membrane protease activity